MLTSVYFSPESLTPQQYDALMASMSSVGADRPAGRVYHVAFQEPKALHIFEVWRSAADFEAFGPELLPILEQADFNPGAPSIKPLRNVISGPAKPKSGQEVGAYIGYRTMTTAQYEQVMGALRKDNACEPPGRSYHMAVDEGETTHFFDIWDSREDFEVFRPRLQAALESVGLEPREPIFVPVHNVVRA